MAAFAQARDLESWKKLQAHHTDLGVNIVLKDFFEQDSKRFEKFSRVFKNTADDFVFVGLTRKGSRCRKATR